MFKILDLLRRRLRSKRFADLSGQSVGDLEAHLVPPFVLSSTDAPAVLQQLGHHSRLAAKSLGFDPRDDIRLSLASLRGAVVGNEVETLIAASVEPSCGLVFGPLEPAFGLIRLRLIRGISRHIWLEALNDLYL